MTQSALGSSYSSSSITKIISLMHALIPSAKANVYNKATKSRVCVKGEMVLKAVDHIKRNLSAPSKFSPSWEGPYLIREANASGYYRLATAEGEGLTEPINGKWLKLFYA